MDPHGDPIPDQHGKFKSQALVGLDQLEPGRKATITSVKDTDPGLLKYLQKIGAKPGTKLQVISRENYDKSIEVLIGKRKVFVSLEVSRTILLSV